MSKIINLIKSPIFLAIILYVLLYSIRLQQPSFNFELDILQEQRKILVQKTKDFLPSPKSELLSGILLGEKQNLPFDLRLALRDTSTLHIVVASGQNLTILAGFIMHLAGLLTRRAAIFLTLLLVGAYTVLTGAQVPIIRAAVMAIFSYLAQIYGRENDGLRALIITASLFLLLNPAWVYDLSFQLSFLATFGVVVVASILDRFLKALPNFIRGNLSVTIGAQLMVLPVIASNFHQLSLVSVFANLLVLWIIPYIMGVGFLFLILGIVWPFVGQILSVGLNIMLTYFIYVVQFFSSLPFAWEYVGEMSWLVWTGYYLIIVSILLSLKKKTMDDRE